MITRVHDGPWDVDALPQRQRPEQGGPGILGELAHEPCHGVPAAGHDQRAVGATRQPPAQHLLGPLDGAPRGEQREGAAACGVEQVRDLLERLLADPLTSRAGQVGGAVEHPLPTVVEG